MGEGHGLQDGAERSRQGTTERFGTIFASAQPLEDQRLRDRFHPSLVHVTSIGSLTRHNGHRPVGLAQHSEPRAGRLG